MRGGAVQDVSGDDKKRALKTQKLVNQSIYTILVQKKSAVFEKKLKTADFFVMRAIVLSGLRRWERLPQKLTTQKHESTTQKANEDLIPTTQKDENTTQKSDILPKRKLCDTERAE